LRGPMHEKELQSGGSGITKRSGAEDSGYLLLFEAVADGMLLATAEGDILDANPEACALLGRAREEVVTAGRGAIFDTSDPRLVTAMEVRREAGRFKGELRLLHRDGTSFPAEVSFAAYTDEGGDEKTVVVFRDVTEREEAERKLREAEVRFRTLVEQIPAITYIEAVDNEEPTTEFLYVSPQIETMFGYSPEEWVADPGLFPKHLHPEDRERVLAEDARTEATGEPFRTEYRQYTRDGRLVWVRDEAVLVHDEAGESRCTGWASRWTSPSAS
jgi:PAS domain S-box-containing protein